MSKYERTEPITSLEEFAKQRFIYDSRMKKVYHCGWFWGWQFHYVMCGIKNHYFYKVKEKE